MAALYITYSVHDVHVCTLLYSLDVQNITKSNAVSQSASACISKCYIFVHFVQNYDPFQIHIFIYTILFFLTSKIMYKCTKW